MIKGTKIIGFLMVCFMAFTACNSTEASESENQACCDDKTECTHHDKAECEDDCEKECCSDKEKEACCADKESCDHHDSESTETVISGDEEAHACTDACHTDGCAAHADKDACEDDCEKDCCKKA